MKIIHIISADKFTPPYIEFINNYFELKEHFFIIYGEFTKKFDLPENAFMLKRDISSGIKLEKLLHSSDKIIIHGLFVSERFLVLLIIHYYLLKKCYWVIWGADLYFHITKKDSYKLKIREYLLKSIIPKFTGIITHIKGDYELSQKWYGAKGRYYYCFMYLSNVFLPEYLERKEIVKESKKQVIIQVGNSADPTNNHIEIFNKLENLKNEDIKIICPLSYGSRKYAEEVVLAGKSIFGNKFQPLLDFMEYKDYLKILQSIDVAIFNHKRQQAVGNITTLLGLGKKVFIREDITTWNFAKELKLRVYSIQSIGKESIFEALQEETRNENMIIIKDMFSLERLKKDCSEIFN
jgi:hypothetical protein